MVLERRSRMQALLLGALCTAGLAIPCSFATDEVPFTGYVRDSFGVELRGVEIFFLHERPGRPPAATAASIEDGSYLVHDLAPGIYRIAASKEGYRLFLGRVNTLVRNSMNLILQPLVPRPGSEGGILPADSAWVLRVPRRGVLHDTSPVEMVQARFGQDEDDRDPAAIHEALRGRVSHTFAVGGSDFGLDRGDLQGMETRLRLAGFLGERGRLRIDGRREDLEGSLPGRDISRTGDHLRSSVGLGFDYQATREADIHVNAFFSHNDFRPLRLPAQQPATVREEQRSWGYDALWSQQLDDISRIDVRMDFRNTSLEMPGAATSPDVPVSQRSIGAGGVFESLPARGHKVKVAFRADFLDLPVPEMRSSLAATGPLAEGDSGWNVGLHAEDSWSVSGPLTLVYGLGYRHVISDRDWILVAPRFGGVMNAGTLSVRAMLSYHAVDSWGTGPAGAPVRLDDPEYLEKLGYETEVETSLPLGFRIRGSASHTPVRLHEGRGAPGSLSGGFMPAYVSDGNAASRQVSVAVLHEHGASTAYLQWSGGRVAGMLAAVRPYDAPYHLLAPRNLVYTGGKLGYRSPPAGLDLVLEYRRQQQELLDLPVASGESFQEQIELRVLQELLRLPGGSAWRLLLAVQRTSFEPYEGDGELPGAVAQLLPITHHRVNAGLTVAF